MNPLKISLFLLFSLHSFALEVKCPSISIGKFEISEKTISPYFQSQLVQKSQVPKAFLEKLYANFENVTEGIPMSEASDGNYVSGRADCIYNKEKQTRSCKSTISFFSFSPLDNEWHEVNRQEHNLQGPVSFYLDETEIPIVCLAYTGGKFGKGYSRAEIKISDQYGIMPFNAFFSLSADFGHERINSERTNLTEALTAYINEYYPYCSEGLSFFTREKNYFLMHLDCKEETFIKGKYLIDPNKKLGGDFQIID